MQGIYLVDIDGTIAEGKSHRSPYDESKVFLDLPLPTIRVIKSLIATGEKIIYFSGRTDGCRLETIKWITKYVDTDEPELYMRKSGDTRSDDIVKKEMYETYIKDKFEVFGVFDDRKRVKRMWVSLGLWVFDVNQKDEEF